ncbi:linoleate diol synthase [Wolfiporia cocos MD-104 SS10]|uniref:Linoleate diol synthase n=1 Tax=Wolfiporia cocos (strain MD-104) TaxID=742152 RepID=A0A2H3J241_WOLCO|nr:linoleate diol synthase [Wolfiporia cocos MD-104 SS10]
MTSRLSRFSTYTSSVENDFSRAEHDATAHAEKLLQSFRDQIKSGGTISWDLQTVSALLDVLKHPDGIDDRKMLLEHILVFLSNHADTAFGQTLSNATVELLYNDLAHPPETYVGERYSWRTADGSNNNMSVPDMGKAGTPYARSVQQTHPLPTNELPDAGLVFDTLLRREAFVKHPAGLSSMMFSFAALVIHSVFRTKHNDVSINETSSYVDLAPLYGNDQAAQDKIRVRDGRGLLHPDTFAEDRLLLLPPAVCVLLVLFNRNHNYIARMLLQLNERGHYVDPASLSADDPQRSSVLLKQEEEIFQTARLCNCAWFASVVFSDYFSAILGLVRQGNSWSLDPFGEIRQKDHTLFERGRGNVCSVEFNCLYRWHATTSVQDEKWIEQQFKQIFPNKTWDGVTIADFRATAQELAKMEPDVTHWTFGNLQRQPTTGAFKDDELAKIIQNATSHPAAAFQARGTPHVMRLHEIMGIESNRQWGCCSLNDFRKFLGLKPYASFLEWNPDPEIARAAEKLYGSIDRLELYVGLQAEAAKPVVEGAGLCPGYTISRAILSDAIALTRGDRFFTADYTPYNMTCWGFADCQRNPDSPGYGSMLGRLLLRTLPDQFASNSSYTWFPLMTPEAMDAVLTRLGDIKTYDLSPPVTAPPVREVSAYAAVAQALADEEPFSPRFASRGSKVISGQGFFIASDDPARAAREQRAMLGVLEEFSGGIIDSIYQKTRELMLSQSYTSVGTLTRHVDLMRDVVKYAPIHWASKFVGIRLKSKPNSNDGDYTPQELFGTISDIYSFLFLDVDSAKLLKLEQRVRADIQKLLGIIKTSLNASSRLSIVGFVETLTGLFTGRERSSHDVLSERLVQLGYPADTLANMLLAVLVGATVEMSQAIINVVNFYLDVREQTGVEQLATKTKLSTQEDGELQGYVLEALRLEPTFRGVYRQATRSVSIGGQSLKAGDTIFVDIASADLDNHVFADASQVNPHRSPVERYLVGDGAARCLGRELSSRIIAQVLRAVFSFRNVHRAPGQSGTLKRFKTDAQRTSTFLYLSEKQELTPWATSMVIQFE